MPGSEGSITSTMRNIRLDVLRCVAVLLVLFRHSGIESRFASAGWIGVDLFFVLSGFLISGLLFNEYKQHRSINFKRFLIRRAFKIYPAFYLLMLVGFLVDRGLFSHPAYSVSQYLREALYLQNYGPVIWLHTWSLAVEEHFYVLLPVLLLFLLHFARDSEDPFHAIPAAFAIIAIACLSFRVLTAGRNASAGEYTIVMKAVYPTHEL